VLVGELLDVPVRRRVLLSAAADGGLDAMFRDVAAETGLRCWLVTGTGRVIGGAGELPRPSALRLAAQYQAARYQAAAAEGRFTLVAVGDGPRITSWFLACAGEQRDWTRDQLQTVADLAADAVHERARLAARLSGERGLAEAVIGRLASGSGEGAEAEALLRAAGLRPGYLAIALRTQRADSRAEGRADTITGELALDRDLAEELLIPYAGRAAVAAAGEEVFAVLPDTEPDALAAWLREAAPVLRAAGITLTAGISGPVRGTADLGGAVREASGARGAASLRSNGTGSVRVATSAEVDSHELLLASVPMPVLRSFRERLLGPVAEYDARHNAELLPTLKSFLACDGSWSACASLMYVHVNTVRYRIGRIEALTGRDLSALPDRVDFFLALRGT
jgi:PucR C-terminal helix-turn-helix domain/GGDEF-like domain